MKRKNIKNKFLIILAFFSIALFGTFFMSTTNTALASDRSLEIFGPNKIFTNEEQVEFAATLINSNYSLKNIEWFYNGVYISPIHYTEGTTTHTSILKLGNSFYASSANAYATISAKINSGSVEIYNTKVVLIESQSHPVTIEIEGNKIQDFNQAGNYEPFIFKISFPSPAEITENITWFLLEDHTKYNPILQSNEKTYSFTATQPGNYTLIAKVGNNFSNQVTARILHKPISESMLSPNSKLRLNDKVVGKNALGFDIYELSLVGFDQDHDLNNINWYRRGFNTPLQYGGDTFVFDPTTYATYQIFAKYEPFDSDMIKESENFLKEIKVDRTKDILIFSSVVIGVMAVGLVVLIYRGIKKDKVW